MQARCKVSRKVPRVRVVWCKQGCGGCGALWCGPGVRFKEGSGGSGVVWCRPVWFKQWFPNGLAQDMYRLKEGSGVVQGRFRSAGRRNVPEVSGWSGAGQAAKVWRFKDGLGQARQRCKVQNSPRLVRCEVRVRKVV